MRVGVAGLDALYWPIAIGQGLQDRDGVEFTAAATLDTDPALIRKSLGISPSEYVERFRLHLYDSAEEMIAQEGLDTVVLVTRHSQHAAWVERLAALGVHLFIPKTFATSEEDAQAIVRSQQRHGVRIAVGPSARYLPPFVAVKQALNQGMIGEPFSLRLCHHHGTIDVFQEGDWYRDAREGGPELSLAWYGIDLVLHLMQDSVRTVHAAYGNFTSPDSPFMDCGRITLGMARGGIAGFDMYFCNRVPYPSWQMEILGPRGVLSIQRTGDDATRTLVSAATARGYQVLALPQETPGWETFWIEEFLAGRQSVLSAEQARTITHISLAARHSAASGQTVTL